MNANIVYQNKHQALVVLSYPSYQIGMTCFVDNQIIYAVNPEECGYPEEEPCEITKLFDVQEGRLHLNESLYSALERIFLSESRDIHLRQREVRRREEIPAAIIQ